MKLTIKKEIEEIIEVSFEEPVYLAIQDNMFYRFSREEKGEVQITYVTIDTYDKRFEVRHGAPFPHDFNALSDTQWRVIEKEQFENKLSEALSRIHYSTI